MKNNLPLEKQICALLQAEKLRDLLGDHAPGSLWVYVPRPDGWEPMLRDIFDYQRITYQKNCITAYSGDELGVLFKNSAKWNDYPRYSTAKEKATLAIEGLTEGWIKPEDFNYGI